jgi:hypothetical protein
MPMRLRLSSRKILTKTEDRRGFRCKIPGNNPSELAESCKLRPKVRGLRPGDFSGKSARAAPDDCPAAADGAVAEWLKAAVC